MRHLSVWNEVFSNVKLTGQTFLIIKDTSNHDCQSYQAKEVTLWHILKCLPLCVCCWECSRLVQNGETVPLNRSSTVESNKDQNQTNWCHSQWSHVGKQLNVAEASADFIRNRTQCIIDGGPKEAFFSLAGILYFPLDKCDLHLKRVLPQSVKLCKGRPNL